MISRYTRPEMGLIWELENRYAKWLDVELAACESMSEEGLIPVEALETIKKKAGFSVERILEISSKTIVGYSASTRQTINLEDVYHIP